MNKGILSHMKLNATTVQNDQAVDNGDDKKPDIVIGIDVGLDGAITVLSKDADLIEIHDIPIEIVKRSKAKTKRLVDIEKLSKLFRSIDQSFNVIAIGIEKVNAMPNQGVVSMFGFGETYGVLKGMAAVCFEAPIHLILPRAWKHEFNLIGSEKDASRILCQNLYPFKNYFKRKKDCDRADAVLIARYLLKLL